MRQDFPGAVIIEQCGLAVSCTRGSELVTCTHSPVLVPHSCSQHSSLFDSKSKPPVPWASSMCGEGRLFICHQKRWCDHCRQPVKCRRVWERAGRTASDWKTFLGLCIRGGSPWWSGFGFLLNDAFFVFCSWPPNPCSSDPAPNLRADWGVASHLHGGAEKIIWRTQREVWYSRKWSSHF